MAKQGDIINNKLTGDIVEFLETSAETGGRYTRIKFTVKPGGFKPVEHIHPQVNETFKVLSGKLSYILNGEKYTLEAGREITLPKGIRHTHFNNEKGDLVMEQTFAPSLDVEVFLENLFGLTGDGRFKNGSPEFLQIMMWLRKLEAKTYLAAIPVSAQKALSFALAPLGRMLGYKASYAKYSGIEI
jgi:quercetin dioxygenase-like cupin family protein